MRALGSAVPTVWDRRARVEEVLDGDTVVVVLDQGFGATQRLSLRLADCYAPEKHDMGGPETKAFVARWVAAAAGDWPFVVTTERVRGDTGEVMSFARYIGWLVRASDGADLGSDTMAFIATQGYGHGTGYPG